MRAIRGNFDGVRSSTTSPMAEVEPILAKFCLKLDDMHRSIDKEMFLRLANSMIRGTETEKKLISWKATHLGYDPKSTTANLGEKYYHGFMKRHEDELWSSSVKALDVNRATWATYDNINKMYDLVYGSMVEAGVAVPLETPVWMDINGNEVESNSPRRMGMQVEHKIIYPNYMLHVDEVGSNTNMKKDKRQGGKHFSLDSRRDDHRMCSKATVSISVETMLNFQSKSTLQIVDSTFAAH